MVSPPLAEALAFLDVVSKFDLSSVKIMTSACADINPLVRSTLFKKFGVQLREGYGLPEATPAASLQAIAEYTEENQGYLLPGTSPRVQNIIRPRIRNAYTEAQKPKQWSSPRSTADRSRQMSSVN